MSRNNLTFFLVIIFTFLGVIMKYKYLKEWTGDSLINLEIKTLQKYQDQYLLTFFKSKESLQISLNQGNSFMFTTEIDMLPWSEEKSLTLFNNILKKSRIISIDLMSDDRIYIINLEKRDIYNETKQLSLICEFAANFENLIVCEKTRKSLVIIDSLKKFSFAENNQRQILPKMEWLAPANDFTPDKEKVIYDLAIESGKIIEGQNNAYQDINDLFESLYYDYIIGKKIEILKKNLISSLDTKLKKARKKLVKQESELIIAKDEEKWLHYAELLKAASHTIKKGMQEISLPNYYQADFPTIVIPLQEDKSPVENSNYYFKKYKKAKVGQSLIAEQIIKTKEEIQDLELEILDIEEEESYLELIERNSEKNIEKRQTDTKILFRRIKIDENWEIFIGRSSTENDMLTCRVAKGRDWWFHTRVFQGTHVVLRNYANKQLPDRYRIICAQLAAYYSKAKKSENVPVDYTQIRFVRKPRGSAAGYVTYKNQKTLYVNPLDYREAMKMLGIKNE